MVTNEPLAFNGLWFEYYKIRFVYITYLFIDACVGNREANIFSELINSRIYKCWSIRYKKRYCIVISIFTNTSARAGYDTRSIFKRSLTSLNSEFSFSKISCLIKAEEPSLPYYLPIAGERIIGFIPLPRVLVLCEMQSVSSRIRTRVAVSISYNDNHYTTGISIWYCIVIYNIITL